MWSRLKELLAKVVRAAKAEESWLDKYREGGIRRGVMCANQRCRWSKEVRGGSFSFSERYRGFVCEDCLYTPLPSVAKSAFDFVTTAITGKPVHVESMQHLQRLEKEHGCSSVVLNCDRSNWDHPKQPRENWQTPPAEVLPHGVTVGEVRQ